MYIHKARIYSFQKNNRSRRHEIIIAKLMAWRLFCNLKIDMLEKYFEFLSRRLLPNYSTFHLSIHMVW